jgi:hypothetical protein
MNCTAKASKENAGYSADYIGSGLTQEPNEGVCSAHWEGKRGTLRCPPAFPRPAVPPR